MPCLPAFRLRHLPRCYMYKLWKEQYAGVRPMDVVELAELPLGPPDAIALMPRVKVASARGRKKKKRYVGSFEKNGR